MKKEKIKRIEATHPQTGRHFSWSVGMLLWNELPEWLLQAVKTELPNYLITINQQKYE